MVETEDYNYDEGLGGDDSLIQETDDNEFNNVSINRVDELSVGKDMTEDTNSVCSSKSDEELSEKDVSSLTKLYVIIILNIIFNYIYCYYINIDNLMQ